VADMSDSAGAAGLVRVALLQLRCDGAEPVAERVARTLAWTREVAADADLVVLPELWHVGAFDIEAARQHAEPLNGPLVGALAEVARSTGTWLHGGSFAEVTSDGSHFNTAVLFAPDGTLAATYRKMHLFGFTGGETTLMSGGTDLVTVATPLGETALTTCYDLRFPEMYRHLVSRGATSTLITSGWPSRRISHWSVLARARAIENQMLVAACNQVGTHADTVLGGHSVIVNALGEVLAEGGADEQVVVADVDLAVTPRWREQFPVLGDRVL